jgi:hypothetical protein
MMPEEREAIDRRIVELKAEMATMNPLSLDSSGVAKWAELYQELDALELRLEDE